MCIETQDVDTLVRTPGVGRKTAERLVVEMRDRVKGFGDTRPWPSAGRRNPDGSRSVHKRRHSARWWRSATSPPR